MTARLAAPRLRNRVMRLISGGALAAFASAGIWVFAVKLTSIEGSIIYDDGFWEPLSGHQADIAARRAGAAFGDAEAFWSRQFRQELGRPYVAASLTYFSVLRPSPCAGAKYASGSFYCEQTDTASMDIAFLDLMGRRMVREGDAGAAMMVGRIAATHAQQMLEPLRPAPAGTRRERAVRDLASALEADCLTGVWARHSADWIEALDAGFYLRLIEAAREVAERRPGVAVEGDTTLLGPGSAEERAAAFGRGRAAGAIRACVPGA